MLKNASAHGFRQPLMFDDYVGGTAARHDFMLVFLVVQSPCTDGAGSVTNGQLSQITTTHPTTSITTRDAQRHHV